MRDYDWQIIVTLHRTGSITKTADQLFISQPALTKRIQAIEAELGIPLLVRSRQGSVFTSEGVLIAEKAEHIVSAIQEVKDLASAHISGEKGALRLGFAYSFVRYIIPSILAEFGERYPNVNVDILTMQSQDLIKGVEDGTLDLCFARYNAEDSVLERKLFSEDLSYVVCNRPFTLDELEDMPYVEFTKNPGTLSAIQRWWNERYSKSPNVRFKVTTGDACIAMIQKGLGYGILLDSRYFEGEEGLFSIPLEYKDGTKLTRKTWIFYRKESKNNPFISAFLKCIDDIYSN